MVTKCYKSFFIEALSKSNSVIWFSGVSFTELQLLYLNSMENCWSFIVKGLGFVNIYNYALLYNRDYLTA
jgi:hypothetical protein